jgi:hypothetical protein
MSQSTEQQGAQAPPQFATDVQKATWTKLGNSFYKTTMSNAISVVTDFELLKAVGTGNEAAAIERVREVIKKNKESREAYLASRKPETAPATQ